MSVMNNRNVSRSSVGFAIFVLVLIVEHRKIRLITALGYIVVFDCLENCATRLVGMGAVGKTALLGELENFLKVAGQFFTLHIEGAKAFDTWGVDQEPLPTSPKGRSTCGQSPLPLGEGWGEADHFREGGGVHACLMGIAATIPLS